jgi:hypothetical protein
LEGQCFCDRRNDCCFLYNNEKQKKNYWSRIFLVDVTLEGVYKAASTHVPPSGAWICVGKVEELAWISVLKR